MSAFVVRNHESWDVNEKGVTHNAKGKLTSRPPTEEELRTGMAKLDDGSEVNFRIKPSLPSTPSEHSSSDTSGFFLGLAIGILLGL